jgi:hypothetical protein
MFKFRNIKLFRKSQPTMSEKATRIIEELNEDLGFLKGESEDALGAFRSTLNNLKGINERIDERVVLADSQIASLDTLKEKLMTNKTSNEKVMNNISKILE